MTTITNAKTHSTSWFEKIQKLNCVVHWNQQYSHLPDPKHCFDARSLEQTSGGDVYHGASNEPCDDTSPTDYESSSVKRIMKGPNDDCSSSLMLFKKLEKRKSVSFGSAEIWSDGIMKSRHEFKNVDDHEHIQDIVAVVNDNSSSPSPAGYKHTTQPQISPTPSKVGSEADQEALREARELIAGAKQMLRRLETKEIIDCNSMEEERQDEEVIEEMDFNQDESKHDEGRDCVAAVTLENNEVLDRELELIAQNRAENGKDAISLNKLCTGIANVNEIVQGFVVAPAPLTDNKCRALAKDEKCPSPPSIRRVHFNDGLNLKDPKETLLILPTNMCISNETRSLVGASLVSSEQQSDSETALITESNHSSTSDTETISTLSIEPTAPPSMSSGSVSVSERVMRWTRAHAKGTPETSKGFFWRSYPNTDSHTRS